MIPRSSNRSRGPGCGPSADASSGGGSGARQALEHGVAHDELVDRIVAAYGVDRARASAGADLYLRQLQRRAVLGRF